MCVCVFATFTRTHRYITMYIIHRLANVNGSYNTTGSYANVHAHSQDTEDNPVIPLSNDLLKVMQNNRQENNDI